MYTMIQENISSGIIELDGQKQQEKLEVQQELSTKPKEIRTSMGVDERKLQEFIGKVVNEWGAAEGALITFVGDRLGLFKAMAGAGEMTSEELAKKTMTHPRIIIKEWLADQAAGGFISYNPVNHTYTLPEEQAFALTDENGPTYIADFYQSIVSLFNEEKIIRAFRTGKGLGWGDHHHYLFEGTERFFKPNYVANLTTSWIPALEDLRIGSKMKEPK